MKFYSQKFVFAALVTGLILIFNQNADAQTLNGEEAVRELKRDGSYDSLMDAIKSEQSGVKIEKPNEPNEQDAVGQTTKLVASDGGVNERFGTTISVSGNTAIVGSSDNVGANGSQGAAYVFVRSGTIWTQQAKLTASDGAAGDRFGMSVAISGNQAIIGAGSDDVGANTDQGSAYIFVRNGTTWTQQAKILASDGAAGDCFGISVAIDGRTVIIGAHYDDVGANAVQGSAYIFFQNGTIWTQQAHLIANDGAANDEFGADVALDGDTAIVGARLHKVGANNWQGSAYVFMKSGSTWTQQAQLTASDGAANDWFGSSVGISGDTVIVGAFLDRVGANILQGSAYVFVRGGTTWTQQAKLIANNGAANDWFGSKVGISGDTIIVGADSDKVGANAYQGSAYVFVRNGSVWTQQAHLIANDGASEDRFGYGVAIDGNTMMVGAYNDDVGAIYDQGSAYVFRNLSGNWTQESFKTASDGATNDYFGISVAISGNTAIVGSYFDDVGANSNQGSAYIFVRNGTTWTQQAKLTASDGAANDFFGGSVAIEGDRVVVGAIYDKVAANNLQGSAYVFIRKGTTWTQQAKLTASDGMASDQFGSSVAIDGSTIIVGAAFDDVGANADQGSAYVFTTNGTNWTQQAKIIGIGGAANDRFGDQVGVSGDTAIVGAYLSDVGANSDQGSAYIFNRSETFWTQQAQLTANDGAATNYFGISVAISGETVIVGAYGDDVGTSTDQGSAYIFNRDGTIWTQQAQLTASDGAILDYFGYGVAIDGDIAVVGAYSDDVGANLHQGSAYIFERSGTNWTQRQKILNGSGAADDRFGMSVAISGDKIVVGAPLTSANDQGAAVFFINQPLARSVAFGLIENKWINSTDEIPPQ